ncbi:MAG: SIS domain-containing protein [Patescibacteria group bacterium]|jgi:glucose/mannose-6-phosphate isomerase
MNSLDNTKVIKKLDPSDVLGSIEMLGEQLNSAWQEFKAVKIPKNYRQINKILINGMGGSALGSHVLRALFFDQLKLPVSIINSYSLPASLDKKTLYIISSYSGNTEEPISTFLEAKKRGAKLFGIASGGKLAGLIKQGKIPGYVFDPIFNPSSQPRLGLGYSLGAQLALVKKLGLIKLSDAEVSQGLKTISQFNNNFGFAKTEAKNPAKSLALKAFGKSLAIVASEFLAGNAHVFANQTNETAKAFSSYYLIPELNHHLLEGLKYPKTNQQSLLFIFLESKLYQPKNQIRYQITKKVVTQNKVKQVSYQLSAKTKFEQVLEALLLSSYVTFYLAILNNTNPTLIPWVDYFKDQLKKIS